VITSSILGLFYVLTSYLYSLKDRILAAGYDSADIEHIGMNAVPGANVNKVLTEEGKSCVTPWRDMLKISNSLETYQN
jgi:hypothetical protein